jgi:hypothetical protein
MVGPEPSFVDPADLPDPRFDGRFRLNIRPYFLPMWHPRGTSSSAMALGTVPALSSHPTGVGAEIGAPSVGRLGCGRRQRDMYRLNESREGATNE